MAVEAGRSHKATADKAAAEAPGGWGVDSPTAAAYARAVVAARLSRVGDGTLYITNMALV